jgi:hypothetical protein
MRKETAMLENRITPFETAHLLDQRCAENIYTRQYNTALSQFRSVLLKGKVFRLGRKLMKRQPYLYDLNTVKPDLHVRGSFYVGVQVVSIRSIIGSESRAADFDMQFHPVSEAARERWINMAMVHLSRVPLPPIQLIRVGDAYFVRDGHHRISVSRAFGQAAMDAEVITWKASSPFPWESGSRAENPNLVRIRTCPSDQSITPLLTVEFSYPSDYYGPGDSGLHCHGKRRSKRRNMD